MIGIWLSSALFVALHLRAYKFRLTRTSAIQAIGIFAVSLALGAIYHWLGLIAAILLHTMIDVIGLYAVRHASA